MKWHVFYVLREPFCISYFNYGKWAILRPLWMCIISLYIKRRPVIVFAVGIYFRLSLLPLDAYWRVIKKWPIHIRPIRWRRIGCAWTGWHTLRGQSSGRSFSLLALTTQTGPGLLLTSVCEEQGDMLMYLLFHSTWTYITLIFGAVCRVSFASFDLDVLKLPSKSQCWYYFLHVFSE